MLFRSFVPVVRTFVPFVCGVGQVSDARFLIFSLIGALIWVGLLVPAGYFFGNLEIVKSNLTLVILLIIFISILPGIIEFVRHKRAKAAT